MIHTISNSAVEPAVMLRAESAAGPCFTDPMAPAAANFNSSVASSPGDKAAIAYSPLPVMAANLFSFVPFIQGETATVTAVHRQRKAVADKSARLS